jgi:hypothetical protein
MSPDWAEGGWESRMVTLTRCEPIALGRDMVHGELREQQEEVVVDKVPVVDNEG